MPDWAQKTLAEHKDDEREYSYTRDELEKAETHDPYWNAAMNEMRYTGYMHNYMRMYWGKKILEWTNTPRYGFDTNLYLNNKYFLDGRDANSFANVTWVYGNQRPALARTHRLRQGALHERSRTQTQSRPRRLRRKGC